VQGREEVVAMALDVDRLDSAKAPFHRRARRRGHGPPVRQGLTDQLVEGIDGHGFSEFGLVNAARA
jgi:hypothetical protein